VFFQLFGEDKGGTFQEKDRKGGGKSLLILNKVMFGKDISEEEGSAVEQGGGGTELEKGQLQKQMRGSKERRPRRLETVFRFTQLLGG